MLKGFREFVSATTKDCPYCLSKIPLKASKCAFCGSDLE